MYLSLTCSLRVSLSTSPLLFVLKCALQPPIQTTQAMQYIMVFSSALPSSHPFSPILAKFLLKETKVLHPNNAFSLSDIQAAEQSSANPCNLAGWCQWKCMTCSLCWVLRAAQPSFFYLIRSLLSFGSAVISIMHTLLLTLLLMPPNSLLTLKT